MDCSTTGVSRESRLLLMLDIGTKFLGNFTSSESPTKYITGLLPEAQRLSEALQVDLSPRVGEQEAILSKLEMEGFHLMGDVLRLSQGIPKPYGDQWNEYKPWHIPKDKYFVSTNLWRTAWTSSMSWASSKFAGFVGKRDPQVKLLTQRVERCRQELLAFMQSYPSSAEDLNLQMAAEKNEVKIVEWLLKYRALVNDIDPEGRTALQVAARCGHGEVVQMLLGEGADINQVDRDDKTALFLAVEGRHPEVVALLLKEPSVQLHMRDRRGNTILNAALGDGGWDIFGLLLQGHGLSPTFGVEEDVLHLISAAAAGDKGAVTTLLDQGVDVNSQDGFGFSALYEASRFGHHEVVTLLLESGANPNGIVGLGGDTSLHGIVDKGRKYERFLEIVANELPVRYQTRNVFPVLGPGHIEVSNALLKSGAASDTPRFDGLTVMDILSKEYQDLSEHTLDEKSLLTQLQDMLRDPPAVELTVMRKWNPLPPKLDGAKTEVCNHFKVRIQYHKPREFKARTETVHSFVYSRSEEDRERFAQLDMWAGTKDQRWRWIHLPANNKLWVKHLIRILHQQTPLNAHPRKVEAALDDTYQEFRGSAPYARYRRPKYTKLSGCDDSAFSLVFPYLDTETEEYLNQRGTLEDPHSRMKKKLEDCYRHGRKDPENLHLACTLDQSYYMSLPNTLERDRQQVVYRYYTRTRDSAEQKNRKGTVPNKKKSKQDGASPKEGLTSADPDSANSKSKPPTKILMVNQFWLWKVDPSKWDNVRAGSLLTSIRDTLLTACPDRWHHDRTANLLGYISRSLKTNPPASLNEMTWQILLQCAGFVDAPCNAGLDVNVFDIFEQSIATLSSNEFRRYQRFRELQKDKQRDKNEATEDEICDISNEIEDLEEIKDIRDELKMIERVLEDQEALLEKYYNASHHHDKPLQDVYLGLFDESLQDLNFRLPKLKRLSKEAESVEQSLHHLLDLKQKQGNLNEARDTRRLANEAEQRAKASQNQSDLLFVFTVVTVIYTPIGFTSAFFSIPSQDFPLNESGSAIGWRWWQIFVGALIAEAVTLVVIFIYFWYGRKDNKVQRNLRMPVQVPTKATSGNFNLPVSADATAMRRGPTGIKEPRKETVRLPKSTGTDAEAMCSGAMV